MENQTFYLKVPGGSCCLLTKMLRLLACYSSSPFFYSKLQPALANHPTIHPNNEVQTTKETLPPLVACSLIREHLLPLQRIL